MSQVAYSQYNQPPSASRPPSAASVSRTINRAHAANKAHAHDYTLVHHGRQVRLGPIAFWIVVGTLVIMATWSIGTGTYFAFKDDVLKSLIGRQASMQFAYEDRIAELRAQVDRITSRQMLDQEQFEQKLQALMRRQALLEQRTSSIAGDVGATGSIKPSKMPELRGERPVKPSPISDTVIFTAPPDREARLQSREPANSNTRLADSAGNSSLEGILAKVSLSLDKVDQRQVAALTNMEEKADSKARAIGGVLADLGVNVGKGSGGAVGGPYVALKAPRGDSSAFERQIWRINVARAQLNRYTQALATVPVRKPVYGEVEQSSPFGMRMDPFLGGPAIHTGVDLRGDTGDPVRVTANGRVTRAAWAGGYGNMVEVDHGNGLVTRYGHMSKIEVKVGQHVTMGQTIGRIGSTGRSTGPHLHYEVRIDEKPVNPQKFLRAGLQLGSGVLGANI